MEYAFLKIELLFSTVACKPKIGSWRWVDEFIISDFWVRGRGVSVIVGVSRWKKTRKTTDHFLARLTLLGCAITSRTLMQAPGLCARSCWPGCFVDVCRASCSYYMQVPAMFENFSPLLLLVSSSGACVRGGKKEKKTKLLQQFWLLQICFQHLTPVPFFCLFIFFKYLRCCLSFLTANPNYFSFRRHGRSRS